MQKLSKSLPRFALLVKRGLLNAIFSFTALVGSKKALKLFQNNIILIQLGLIIACNNFILAFAIIKITG